MADVRENIANNIKKYRESNGLSQRELAKRLGVGYSSVSNWELGLNSPSIELLMKVCEVFDIKLATMYGITENAEKDAQNWYLTYKAAPDDIKQMVDTLLRRQLQQLDHGQIEAEKKE
jgi:transcriptional regulator with XRE-family HTH domain